MHESHVVPENFRFLRILMKTLFDDFPVSKNRKRLQKEDSTLQKIKRQESYFLDRDQKFSSMYVLSTYDVLL